MDSATPESSWGFPLYFIAISALCAFISYKLGLYVDVSYVLVGNHCSRRLFHRWKTVANRRARLRSQLTKESNQLYQIRKDSSHDESCKKAEVAIPKDSDFLSVDLEEKSHKRSRTPDGLRKTLQKVFNSSNYKTKCEDFKKLFKDHVTESERLLADYSCGLLKDIIIHGRLYISQNWVCFRANIFKWETTVIINIKSITSITKERTARVVSNAVQITTSSERHIFPSINNRDKIYMMLFRIWQNSLLDQPMSPQDLWYWIHKNYGGDLGLTTEDEDYVEPSSNIPGTQYLIHTDDYDSSSCDTHSISDSDTLKHAKKRQRRKSAAVYAQHLNVDEVTIKKSFSVPDIVVKVALETKGTEKNNNTKSPAKGGKTKSSKNDTSQKNEPVKVQKNRTHSNDSTDSSSEGEDSGDGSDDDDGPTSCTCDNHNGYKPMDIDLDISAKQVYESIFTDSPCIRDFHVSKKMFDIDIEEWMLQEDGKQHRTLTYNLPVKTTLGDKIAHTKDNQVVVKKVPNKLYMVSSEVTNGNIPYGDTFYISSLFCITSISNKRSHIVVTWNVTYVKSTFGFIKSLIEKNTDAGLVDHYKSLAEKLKEHANTPKSSGKLRSAEPNAEFKPKNAVPRAPQGVPKSAGVPYYASSSIFGIGANTVLIIMIIVMLSVVVVNVMLYSQLKALEYKSTQQDIYGDLFDFNKIGGRYPTSDNDWLKLFYQQKYLHNQEMEKMSDVVTVTAQMVEQMQKSITDLKDALATNTITISQCFDQRPPNS